MEIQQTGKLHLLWIAIDRYKHKFWPTLSNAVSGSEALEGALHEAFGVTSTQTIALKNRQATQAEIEKCLRSFGPGGANELSDEDQLIISFAGHGERDLLTGETAFIPFEADPDSTSTWFKFDHLRPLLRIIKARHILVISDSCFSGGVFRSAATIEQASNDTAYARRAFVKNSRQMISSGGVERTSDGSARPGKSVFLEGLLYGLRTAEPGWFLADQLFRETRNFVIANADQTPEFGRLDRSGHGGGQIVLFKKNQPGEVFSQAEIANVPSKESPSPKKPLFANDTVGLSIVRNVRVLIAAFGIVALATFGVSRLGFSDSFGSEILVKLVDLAPSEFNSPVSSDETTDRTPSDNETAQAFQSSLVDTVLSLESTGAGYVLNSDGDIDDSQPIKFTTNDSNRFNASVNVPAGSEIVLLAEFDNIRYVLQYTLLDLPDGGVDIDTSSQRVLYREDDTQIEGVSSRVTQVVRTSDSQKIFQANFDIDSLPQLSSGDGIGILSSGNLMSEHGNPLRFMAIMDEDGLDASSRFLECDYVLISHSSGWFAGKVRSDGTIDPTLWRVHLENES